MAETAYCGIVRPAAVEIQSTGRVIQYTYAGTIADVHGYCDALETLYEDGGQVWVYREEYDCMVGFYICKQTEKNGTCFAVQTEEFVVKNF